MGAPHHIRNLKRADFMAWLENAGASLAEPTNPFEVVRYRMWCEGDTSRPSTHIVYKRKNDTLTWAGQSRTHYDRFLAARETGGAK
jgi:hypothetical protein